MEREAGYRGNLEQQVRAERDVAPGDHDGRSAPVVAGGEMPALVELAVSGKIRLGSHPVDPPPGDDDGAVEKPVHVPQRRADDQDARQLRRCRGQGGEGLFDRVENRLLQQQIVDRIAGQTQLGEHGQDDALGTTEPSLLEHGGGITGRVGDRDRDRAGGDSDESLVVGVTKVHNLESASRWSVRRSAGPGPVTRAPGASARLRPTESRSRW